MTMTPRLSKFALTAHVTFSVGWLGAAAAYLALAVAALASQDAQMVRAAYLAMEPTGWFALVPLALASLLTGLVSSLGTEWGVFRHYWVLAKLLLTLLAVTVLLMHMSTVSFLADVAAKTDSANPAGLRGEILHAGLGLLVLLTTTTLGLYKPRGLTWYGRRKQEERQGVEPERGSTASTPRWVKVFGILLIVLVLLFVIKLLTGHGPGDHAFRDRSGATYLPPAL